MMYLPRVIISVGSLAVMFADKSLELPVFLMAARMAFPTSGKPSFIRQNA